MDEPVYILADTYSEEATSMGDLLTLMWDSMTDETKEAVTKLIFETARDPSRNN